MPLLLSKAIGFLALPPGSIIVLMGLGIALAAFGKKRPSIVVFSLAAGLLLLLSLEPVSDALNLPLESAYPYLSSADEGKAGLVVVLGGGVGDGSPRDGRAGALEPHAVKRAAYGMELALRGGKRLLYSGGRSIGTGETEAAVARRFFLGLGFPEERLVLESESRTTEENAFFVKGLVGRETFILVTSAWHMKRSMTFFEEFGMAPIPAPTDYAIDGAPYDLSSFFPTMDSFGDSCAALHEYLGLLYGTIK